MLATYVVGQQMSRDSSNLGQQPRLCEVETFEEEGNAVATRYMTVQMRELCTQRVSQGYLSSKTRRLASLCASARVPRKKSAFICRHELTFVGVVS